MNKKVIYYSIRNGGDGSAYPYFYESEELAEWDQEHLMEGWGESCTGSVTIESDSDLILVREVITIKEYFEEEYLTYYGFDIDIAVEFVEQFFPEGLPKFPNTVENEYEDQLNQIREKLNEST
jgi:hypothetical protein